MQSLSHLRAFPCDRFKIYTIIPIVRIERNSIQATARSSQSSGSFVIVRVVFPHNRSDRLDNIWDDWEDRDDPDDPWKQGLGGQFPRRAAADAVRVYEIDYIFAF